MKALILTFAFILSTQNSFASNTSENIYDELDPRSPDIEKTIQELTQDYIQETGKSPFLEIDPLEDLLPTCYRNSCNIWADVDKSNQRLYLYINGVLTYTWKTSTGRAGYTTPDMDRHPSGPIFDSYTSKKYPGGDYNGLGNMPYAVFVQGGYAIHGTTQGNWGKLGKPASHGCVRIHPDNGFIFNRLVRKNGMKNVWVTIN